MTHDTAVLKAIDGLPGELRDGVRDRWRQLSDSAPGSALALATDARAADSLARVWACSEFISMACVRHPADVRFLLGEGGISSPWTPGSLDRLASDVLSDVHSESDAMSRLRIFRRRQTVRAAWRDLAGWSRLDETLGHLSELADACIREALAFGHGELAATCGDPLDADGRPQSLLVLGMGKLGGHELNFSSDVDLVLLFPASGMTAGPRSIPNEQFFIRLGQRLIRLLDQVTEDGFVFRVDLRLRPFGDSGPLAISLAAFEDYLQQHGRSWERYAYVKARPISGHSEGMGLYTDLLRPFVYRRYLDYGVFESLRRMKQLIEVEAGQRGLADDLKRGPGGIREIEFIVQCFQLLRGGADPALREPALQEVLPRLAATRQLASRDADDLASAYRFLRTAENHLQEWQDRQVHRLPRDDEGRARLAFSMGFDGWRQFAQELGRHRERVDRFFRHHVVGEARELETTEGEAEQALWAGRLDPVAAGELLAAAGFDDPERAEASLERLRRASFVRRLDESGRRRLDALMPAVVREAGRCHRSAHVLERLIDVITAVGLRSAYLALLNENRGALARLADICGRSDFLARQVADHPLLLDELIDPRIFEQPPARAALEADLAERMVAVQEDELESQMEALRQFQRSAVFLVAVADLSGAITVMQVSDRLTEIAEVVLEHCVSIALRDMVGRHGVPLCGEPGATRQTGFAVIGYGKLGGIELGYGSDLDLVFMHDSEGSIQQSDGERSLDNRHYFARLGRRLVHLLSTQTSSGMLYEVDTRLKPSGKGGLLVTSLGAFETYQREQAWTWEHQALLRARAVAGDETTRAGFERIRREILCKHVRREGLRAQVVEMRDKMWRELARGDADHFDIKQDRGGLADIEFLVQYLVLAGADRYPALVDYSDNIRQLDSLVETGLLPRVEASMLRDAWLAYRARLHRLALEKKPGVIPADEFQVSRRDIRGIWKTHMAAD